MIMNLILQNQIDSLSDAIQLNTGCLQDTSWWIGYIEPNCSGWGGLFELYPPIACYITVESSCLGWGGVVPPSLFLSQMLVMAYIPIIYTDDLPTIDVGVDNFELQK